MSSRTKNFRRRADDEDDDDDDDNPNGTVPPSTSSSRTSKSTATAKPKKPTTPHHQAPKKLLSFAQDDDEDDSPISRPLPKSKPSSSSSSRLNNNKPSSSSSSSHKHTSSKDRPPPPPSNVQPLSGTYTPEALLELRKNTRTLVPSSSSHHRPPPSEPVVLLKGLVKPVSETLKQADELDRDDDREEEATTARLAGIGLGNSFPDQATINAIRARRERQRQSRAAAPDFISLDGGSNHGEAEGLSDEEPEFRGRIGFFGDKIEKKKGVFDNDDGVGERVLAMEGDGFRKEVVDEEEEEDKIWEEEQFRKGLGKRMDEASSSGGRVVGTSSNSVALPVVAQSIIPQQKYAYAPAVASYPSVPSIGGVVGGLPGLEVMSIPQQAEIAKKALHDNLKRMKESHGRTMASLDRNDENLTTSLLKVTALEKSLSAAGERFIFMQKLRDFVSVICDFLQHKAPFIEELEKQMQKLNEDRAAAILKRRSSDNDDEMLELEAAINAQCQYSIKVVAVLL
ncbi:hypothetical protein C3L33_03615, partial [Rhododendron williamsianum]